MTRMPDFEADIRRDIATGAHAITGLIHPHHRDQAAEPADDFAAREDAARHQFALNTRSFAEWFEPTPKENHMSKLTELQTVIEDGAARARELASNPLILAIAEAGLGTVLTPGEITFLTGMIREFEQARANAPQQAAPIVPAAEQPQNGPTDPRQFG